MDNTEIFREDRWNPKFREFKIYPTDSPACEWAEAVYKKVLREGKINDKGELQDPFFPNYKIAKLVKAEVIAPAEWFGREERLNGKLVVVKNPNPDTTPNSNVAISAGATTGLVEVKGKLYIAVPDGKRYRIQRPVLSEYE